MTNRKLSDRQFIEILVGLPSSKRAFSSVAESVVLKIFSGGKPPDLNFPSLSLWKNAMLQKFELLVQALGIQEFPLFHIAVKAFAELECSKLCVLLQRTCISTS